MSDGKFAHVVGLLLPLFGAAAKTEDQVKSRLFLDVTGGRGVTTVEVTPSY